MAASFGQCAGVCAGGRAIQGFESGREPTGKQKAVVIGLFWDVVAGATIIHDYQITKNNLDLYYILFIRFSPCINGPAEYDGDGPAIGDDGFQQYRESFRLSSRSRFVGCLILDPRSKESVKRGRSRAPAPAGCWSPCQRQTHDAPIVAARSTPSPPTPLPVETSCSTTDASSASVLNRIASSTLLAVVMAAIDGGGRGGGEDGRCGCLTMGLGKRHVGLISEK